MPSADPGIDALAGLLAEMDVPATFITSTSRKEDGARLRDFLIESGRINHVTLDGVKQAGAVYTWWLGPGEPIAGEDGKAWPKGAFVYLYREGDEAFDCFLALA